MLIYHGSTETVNKPVIKVSQRTLDYGNGFYATTSYRQAEKWTKRRMQEKKTGTGYVNVYEFDVQFMHSCKSLSFPAPTEEWLDFVMANRTRKGYVHDYDIVYGPVANDRVYAAFALYEGGIIDRQTLIKELRTYKLVDQYLFHSERSLESITFIEAKEIRL